MGPGCLQFPSAQLDAASSRQLDALKLRATRRDLNAIWVQTAVATVDLGILLQDGAAAFSNPTKLTAENSRPALGTRARRLLLSNVNKARLDSQGIELLDLHVSSHWLWNNLSSADTSLLFIWKGGAICTPTRRYHRPQAPEPPELKACKWCHHPQASARHFFVGCEHFSPTHIALQQEHDISPEWWALQPRCTTKSGCVIRRRSRLASPRSCCSEAASS